MASYFEQLRDPRWQKRRLEIFERDRWRCTECGAKDSEIHVHHARYHSGKKPWEYADSDLRTMCAPCHKSHTEITREVRGDLYNMLQEDIDTAANAMRALTGLFFLGGPEEIEIITEITRQTSRAAIARADHSKVREVLFEALELVTELAKEAERGSNQNGQA